MKKILLTLVAFAALVLPASAYAPQNNLFLELSNSQILHKGEPVMLEDVQALITSCEEPTDNVIVTADDKSAVAMMIGIRDCVAEVSQAQVLFIVPMRRGYHGSMNLFTPAIFTLDPSPYFEPLTSEEFYTEQALWESGIKMPKEEGGITVLMKNINEFYMGGEQVHYSIPIASLKDVKVPNEEVDVPYLRVKLGEDASVEDLLTYEYTLSWHAVNETLEMNYAFFTPDSRVAQAAAFNINPASLDEIEIATVDYAEKDTYSVATTYAGYSDLMEIIDELGRYFPYDPGHARGRAIVAITVGIDGTIKEIEYVNGMKAVYNLAEEALRERAFPFWSQALDLEGNPVNMRLRLQFKISR